jgi:hypothetical protein
MARKLSDPPDWSSAIREGAVRRPRRPLALPPDWARVGKGAEGVGIPLPGPPDWSTALTGAGPLRRPEPRPATGDCTVVRPHTPSGEPAVPRVRMAGDVAREWCAGKYLSALDVPLIGRSGSTITLGGLRGVMASAGMTFVEDSDLEEFARGLVGRLAGRAHPDNGGGGGEGGDGQERRARPTADPEDGDAKASLGPEHVESEDEVRPNPTFGVSGFTMPVYRELRTIPGVDAAVDEGGGATNDPAAVNRVRYTLYQENAPKYGRLHQIVGDVRACGAGWIRRAGPADLTWPSIFGEKAVRNDLADIWSFKVPKPADVRAWVASGGYEYLYAFTWLVLVCYLEEVEFTPTLFDFGGGSGAAAGLNAMTGELPGPSNELWADVLAMKPDWQNAVILPSGLGWDEFYWELSELGMGPPPDIPPDLFRSMQLNAQYTLRLWYTSGPEVSQLIYFRRTALRKGLFLAAFSDAIGAYLVALTEALRAWDPSFALNEVIPYFEVANEPGALWNTADGTGYKELARFTSLLVAPILQHLPSARFRFAELASEATNVAQHRESFNQATTWLAEAHAYAVRDEFNRWNALLAGTDPDTAEWRATCTAAGFQWPPASGFRHSGAGMFHQVGMHWYHCWYQDADPAAGTPAKDLYVPGWHFLQDLNRLGTAFPTRSLSTGEIGFQAVEKETAAAVPYYPEANPVFQASMLVRLLLLAKGSGVERIAWHTFMSIPRAPESRAWDLYTSMGLRNDVGPDPGFMQNHDAWRRPSWFALRRLTWLFGQATSVTIHRNDPRICVQMYSTKGFSTNPMATSARGPSHAYIAWIDQYQDGMGLASGLLTLRASLPGATYETLSLVPSVDEAVVGAGAEFEYPQGDDPEWEWPGFHRSIQLRDYASSRFGTTLTFAIRPADAPMPTVERGNPGLVCIFTDAERVSI